MDDWVQWNLKDGFKVQIPADATTRIDDDGTTAVVRLPRAAGVTEVLLSNYPLEKVALEKGGQADALGDIVRDFFGRAVVEAFGHAVPFDVEPVEDPDLDVSCAQGVAVFEREGTAVWVVRVYARPGDPRFWLIHWNGSKENLEVVMRIFVSFEPAEASFR
jgi:hypothetical protein